MINNNYFCVLDFETDGVNPRQCNPLQVACVMVHPRDLEVVKGSEFSSWMRPEEFDKDEKKWLEDHKDTIVNFHCKNFNEDVDTFVERVRSAPSEKQAMKNLSAYLKSWYVPNKAKSKFNAPILTGYNLHKFDKIIMDRLAKKHKHIGKDGTTNLFCVKHCVDILDSVFMWSESLTFLENYKLDNLRDKFGINHEGMAHEALKDCYDEATLLIKYLNLHRESGRRVKGWHQ